MKIRTIVLAVATLGLGPAAWIMPQLSAQPLWDVVKVTFPYTVTIGQKTLAPGDYTIQQLHTDGSNVLLFYNGNGMKFQTSAMTIKALELKTPEDTSVILHHIGDEYYMDKIWIQGKSYGYEFPLPNRVKSREKEMAAVTVPAQASTTNVATEVTQDTSTVTSDDATPPPVVDSTPIAPLPAPEPVMSMPVTPTPVATTDDTPQTPLTVEPASSDDSANREKRPSDDTSNMPATSAGWLAMMLGGSALSGAGMLLRRKR